MEERAKRIVRVAIELAEKGGFEGVRLRDVAEIVAVTRSAADLILGGSAAAPYRDSGLPPHREHV